MDAQARLAAAQRALSEHDIEGATELLLTYCEDAGAAGLPADDAAFEALFAQVLELAE
jgi:hypothetical protein